MQEKKGSLQASVSTSRIPEQRLKKSLTEGHAAEIRYRFRLYKKRDGLLSIIGDSLVEEISTTYRTMWNPVFERYELHRQSDTAHTASFYKEYSDLLSTLFSSAIELDFQNGTDIGSGETYILAQVTLIPEVPVPPFNLLAPFMNELRISSPWIRMEEHP